MKKTIAILLTVVITTFLIYAFSVIEKKSDAPYWLNVLVCYSNPIFSLILLLLPSIFIKKRDLIYIILIIITILGYIYLSALFAIIFVWYLAFPIEQCFPTNFFNFVIYRDFFLSYAIPLVSLPIPLLLDISYRSFYLKAFALFIISLFLGHFLIEIPDLYFFGTMYCMMNVMIILLYNKAMFEDKNVPQ